MEDIFKDRLKEIFAIFKTFSLREPSKRHFVVIVTGNSTGLAMEYRPGTKNLFYTFPYDTNNIKRLNYITTEQLSYLLREEYIIKFSNNIANASRMLMRQQNKRLEKLMDEYIKDMDNLSL